MLIVPYRDARPDHALTLTSTPDGCHEVTVRRGDREDRLQLDLRAAGSARLVRTAPGKEVRRLDLTPGP